MFLVWSGLKEGDKIIEVNGVNIEHVSSIFSFWFFGNIQWN